jgi:hypothetical protein
MKNILMVSIAFPPKNDPECIQSGKYFKYLNRLNWNFHIVTSSIPTLHMPYDSALEELARGATQTISIPIRENKYLNYFWRKTGYKNLEMPDSKVAFISGKEKVIQELKSIPDLIYSRSFPVSSALLAEKLRDHYQVPWVLHLSDPWSISPIHHFHGELKEFHSTTESRLFDKADLICLSSERAIEAYKKTYPQFKAKFFYSPNVYDEEGALNPPQKSKKTLNICYTGGLAGRRSPMPIIRAFQELYEHDAELCKNVKLHFAGPFDRRNRKILQESGLPFLINHGLLSYKKSIELQAESDLLLLIDTPVNDPSHSLFFPSKFLDYLQARRKIIALTYEGSPIDSVMKEEHGFKAYYGNEGQLNSILKKLLHAFKYSESTVFRQNAALLPEFSAMHQASRLSDAFSSLIANGLKHKTKND